MITDYSGSNLNISSFISYNFLYKQTRIIIRRVVSKCRNEIRSFQLWITFLMSCFSKFTSHMAEIFGFMQLITGMFWIFYKLLKWFHTNITSTRFARRFEITGSSCQGLFLFFLCPVTSFCKSITQLCNISLDAEVVFSIIFSFPLNFSFDSLAYKCLHQVTCCLNAPLIV